MAEGGFGPSLSDFKALAPENAAEAGPPQGWGIKIKTQFLIFGEEVRKEPGSRLSVLMSISLLGGQSLREAGKVQLQ